MKWAAGAYDPEGIVQRALRIAKEKFPELYYVTDVCVSTLPMAIAAFSAVMMWTMTRRWSFAKTALSHVEAGADMVAPSDMMDGRVAAIRQCLDKAGHYTTPIMSYAVKICFCILWPVP